VQGVLTGFAVIAVVIGVGYVIGLRGYLGDNGREVLTKLAFHVATPALLFTMLAKADLSVIFSSRLLITALSTIAAASVFIAVGVVRRWGAGRTTIGALCSSYVNSGNLGIPIAVYVLGDASLVAPVLLFQLIVVTPIATGSSLRARPAPSRQAATPTPVGVERVSTPSAVARSTCGLRAWAAGVRVAALGPIIARQESIAAPSTRAPSAGSASVPGRGEHLRASARVSSTTSAGPPPASTSTDSATSTALPTARPSGVFMSVSRATVFTPCVGAELDHGLGQLAGVGEVLHERAGADLHVQHQRAGALGDLLAHDRAGDQRDRLDRAGDVAQRVQLAVGRGQPVAGRADHRADLLAAGA
jgi:hypothetical protein